MDAGQPGIRIECFERLYLVAAFLEQMASVLSTLTSVAGAGLAAHLFAGCER